MCHRSVFRATPTRRECVSKETRRNVRVIETTYPPLNKMRLLRCLLLSPSRVSLYESYLRHLLFQSVSAVWFNQMFTCFEWQEFQIKPLEDLIREEVPCSVFVESLFTGCEQTICSETNNLLSEFGVKKLFIDNKLFIP